MGCGVLGGCVVWCGVWCGVLWRRVWGVVCGVWCGVRREGGGRKEDDELRVKSYDLQRALGKYLFVRFWYIHRVSVMYFIFPTLCLLGSESLSKKGGKGSPLVKRGSSLVKRGNGHKHQQQ